MATLNSVKIENTELVRDMNSKAVVSTDVSGLSRYREQRKRNANAKRDSLETKQRLQIIEGEMLKLKEIISEIAVMRSKS